MSGYIAGPMSDSKKRLRIRDPLTKEEIANGQSYYSDAEIESILQSFEHHGDLHKVQFAHRLEVAAWWFVGLAAAGVGKPPSTLQRKWGRLAEKLEACIAEIDQVGGREQGVLEYAAQQLATCDGQLPDLVPDQIELPTVPGADPSLRYPCGSSLGKTMARTILIKLIVVLTLIGLAPCEAASLKTEPIKGEIVNCGTFILSDKKDIEDSTSPLGIRTEADFLFSDTATNIPAVIGITFGIEFVLTGGNSRDVPVLTRIKFPEINGQTSYERTRNIRIGAKDAFWYTFDVEEELALGNWVFEAFSGNTKLFEKHFRVVAPGSAAATSIELLESS